MKEARKKQAGKLQAGMKEARKKQARTYDNLRERDLLIDLYLTQEFDSEEIADLLNWSRATVFNRLKFHGITSNCKPDYCSSCGHVIEEPKELDI